MNPAERKTFLLMKVTSIGFILAIVIVLYSLSKEQSKISNSQNLVSSVKLKLLETYDIKPISSYPWHKENFSSAILDNKITYVNYWAEWCEPCLTEIPYLKKLANKFPQINFIFVNVDSPENKNLAQKWWSTNGTDLTTFYAKNNHDVLKHTRGIPYHQIYDKNKNMISHFSGNIDNKELEINNLITKVLQFK